MKKIFLLLCLACAINFTSFAQEVPQEQTVVVSKIGATWCPNCGTYAWDQFTDVVDKYDGQAVILSLHPSSSSRLHSPESIDFSRNLPQAFGQPLFYVHRTKYATSAIVNETGAAISQAQNTSPLANAGIKATIKGNSLEVTAKVKFFQEGNGEYYLSLLIVEDGVIENQSNRGSNVSHKKILRSALMGGTFGSRIASGAIPSNSEYNFTDTKNINIKWNTDNLEVAAIIWKKTGETYEFVNANSVNASFSTSLNALEIAGVELSVSPTILQNNSIVNVEVPTSLAKVNISLFNTNGQHVHQVYEGELKSGNHKFSVSNNEITTSGIYFLRMESNGAVISKKLVVE